MTLNGNMNGTANGTHLNGAHTDGSHTSGTDRDGVASKEGLRAQIMDLVERYHEVAFAPQEFVGGESKVPVSGKVFDASEIQHMVDASLDCWLTAGRFATQFEREFARVFKMRHSLLVNSGSSANLLAFSCLTSPLLGERRLVPGDEVITVAAGFPTTVNPIIQNGMVPVFCDVKIPTYDVDVSQLEDALSPRTRAVMMAHTLGNTFDLDEVTAFCREHNLYLIEDCCDALGTTYRGQHVGNFGDVATSSFYPAHHITMGEGGAVLTNRPHLKKIIESLRDWGRDCWCPPGCDNTCGKRYGWHLGDLPPGYDHKYTYSHIGYNLKVSDMQAAVGVAQLQKLPGFIEARKRNFARLYTGLQDLEEFFVLPEATPHSDPSWFGFLLGVRDDAPFTRDEVTRHLEAHHIGTRLLFAGNLVRQPAYKDINCRIVSDLKNSNWVMHNVFWIGLHPGLSEEMLAYVTGVIHAFVADKCATSRTRNSEQLSVAGVE